MRNDETFFSRWSRRKHEAQQEQVIPNQERETPVEPIEPVIHLTDADMPPIESLTEESDYSVFLSPRVSEALRKQALRKLFRGAGFNVRDGLDDYDEDYTEFVPLGDIVTADVRHLLEREMQKQDEKTQEEPEESGAFVEQRASNPPSDQVQVTDAGIETEEKTS